MIPRGLRTLRARQDHREPPPLSPSPSPLCTTSPLTTDRPAHQHQGNSAPRALSKRLSHLKPLPYTYKRPRPRRPHPAICGSRSPDLRPPALHRHSSPPRGVTDRHRHVIGTPSTRHQHVIDTPSTPSVHLPTRVGCRQGTSAPRSSVYDAR